MKERWYAFTNWWNYSVDAQKKFYIGLGLGFATAFILAKWVFPG